MRATPWRSTLGWLLDRLADDLFAPVGARPEAGARWLARYLALAGVLALIIVARRPQAIAHAQFWADDNFFFRDQLTLGFWPAARSLYAGFPYVAARLIAAAGALVPFALTPLAYNVSAIAVTALAMATFCLPRFCHLVRSDGIRTAFCVGTVCIPAYPALLSTLTDTGWFLAIWLVLVAVMAAPRSPAGVLCWSLGSALAVASTPLAPVAAPLWALRAVRGARAGFRPDLVFGVTQFAALGAVLAITGTRSAGTLQTLPDGSSALAWQPGDLGPAVGALGWVLASVVDAALMPLIWFNRWEQHGTAAVLLPALAVTVVLGCAVRDVSRRGRVTIGLAVYLFAVSLFLALAGRPGLVTLLQDEMVPGLHFPTLAIVGVRHRAMANVALLLVLAGLLDGARHVRTRIGAAIAAGVVCLAWGAELRFPPAPDVDWPLWAQRLEHKRDSGDPGRLVIPAYPPGYQIVLDGSLPTAR